MSWYWPGYAPAATGPSTGMMPPTATTGVRRSLSAVAHGMPPLPALTPAGTVTSYSGRLRGGTGIAFGVCSGTPSMTSITASLR